jgi:hypothetical protein
VGPLGASFVSLVDAVSGNVVGPSGWPPLNAKGGFKIVGVPPGTYRAIFRPDPAVPFAPQTYRSLAGVDPVGGTTFTVQAGLTTTGIKFAPPAAGYLMVTVTDAMTSALLAGVSVLVFDTARQVLIDAPVVTDESGTAIVANVPLASKLALGAPAGYASTWWGGAADWASTVPISIPAAGTGVVLAAALALSP